MDLPEQSLDAWRAALDCGDWTSLDLCEEFLRRIRELDAAGPGLRSVIEINPDALEIAAALDAERRERGARGPWHGVPVMVKDSLDTGDRMLTTAGSLALVGNRARRDACVVRRLRDAGAVLLAKTNMSEWGYMRSTRACSGWSSRGGQTRNPYVLDRSPLGSSSGSAVAVAANLCVASIGAEVDGSIVRPASANGIVGLKPSVGLVSRRGVIGVAEPQDTAGPMGRCVADVAALLNAVAGTDPDDPATASADARRPGDYRDALRPDALRGSRLGVARECFSDHEGTRAVIEGALETLRRLGAEIIDPVRATTLPFFGPLELELFQYGIKANIDAYLAEHPGALVRDFGELIEYNRRHAAEVMPTSSRSSSSWRAGREPGTMRAAGTSAASCAAWPGPKESTGRSPSSASTPSSRPPKALRPSRSTPSSETTSCPSAAPRRRPWRATRTCRYPPDSSTSCPWDSPSSAGPSRRRSCSATPSPSSAPPRRGKRRASCRAFRRLLHDLRFGPSGGSSSAPQGSSARVAGVFGGMAKRSRRASSGSLAISK
jgi:amidase